MKKMIVASFALLVLVFFQSCTVRLFPLVLPSGTWRSDSPVILLTFDSSHRTTYNKGYYVDENGGYHEIFATIDDRASDMIIQDVKADTEHGILGDKYIYFWGSFRVNGEEMLYKTDDRSNNIPIIFHRVIEN